MGEIFSGEFERSRGLLRREIRRLDEAEKSAIRMIETARQRLRSRVDKKFDVIAEATVKILRVTVLSRPLILTKNIFAQNNATFYERYITATRKKDGRDDYNNVPCTNGGIFLFDDYREKFQEPLRGFLTFSFEKLPGHFTFYLCDSYLQSFLLFLFLIVYFIRPRNLVSKSTREEERKKYRKKLLAINFFKKPNPFCSRLPWLILFVLNICNIIYCKYISMSLVGKFKERKWL